MRVTKKFIDTLKKDPIVVLKTLSEDDIATIIQKANDSYYNKNTPLFSDNTFDIIKEYLESINPHHPILKNVGAVVKGDKVKLPYYMGSLDKIKSDQKELDKFKKSYYDFYVISDKLDGNSALLEYSKTMDPKLFTRGDGVYGQDISYLIPFINNISKITINNDVAIRGELIISKCDFEKVKDKGANPRNMVAGIVNSKKPDMDLVKYLRFVAYELIEPKLTPEKQLAYLNRLGFTVVYHETLNKEELTLEELSKILLKRRDNSEYDVDGIVVYHNELHNRISKENPKYAFAFKSTLTMEKAEVIVTSVEWNMSKDGYLIPVVIFNPISLNGVTIKRAHGFNGKFINDNKIGPGSKIVIMRSGDVIPYITDILTPSETGHAQMPTVKFSWSKTGVDIIAINEDLGTEVKDELAFKNIEYFFNKIDVKGLSSGNIKKLFESGLTTVKDILYVTKEQLLKVEGFKVKMAEKIFDAINERKKELDCLTVMDASNIFGRGIGSKKLELIMEKYPQVNTKRYIPTLVELTTIKGVEQTTAKKIIENLPRYFEFIDKNNIKCKLTDDSSSADEIDIDFKGMKFVFTGFRNAELEKLIKNHNGSVSTSISKNTSLLIRKDTEEESTKITKAKELNIKIITLSEFIKKFNLNLEL